VATETTASPVLTRHAKPLDAGHYDELLKMVSQDLRNALAPMCYLLELLLKETATTNPIRPLLQMVRQYRLRISRLADVLDARAS